VGEMSKYKRTSIIYVTKIQLVEFFFVSPGCTWSVKSAFLDIDFLSSYAPDAFSLVQRTNTAEFGRQKLPYLMAELKTLRQHARRLTSGLMRAVYYV